MAPALIQEVEDDASPPTTFILEPVEATLRRLLLDVAKYIDDAPSHATSDGEVELPEELAKQPIILRFTGGWVRDKLLDVRSHDIDVAINKMTGYQFGLKMKEYLEIPGNPEKYSLEGVATTDKQSQKAGTTDKSKTVGGLHKIEANPEKSKHLETVTTKILGLDIDLVNLRKETYTDDSRNPQMEFGTPEEDALRRDATVNAMFYNINTEEIEDFTGRGHEDMRQKHIRTPLEPYQTFKDDPLRVMRLIRFASRLGYTIDPKALNAMRDPDIKDALRRKISRERVGVELEKALRGHDPHEALRLIFELDLYETIFSDPTAEHAAQYQPDVAGWKDIINKLRELVDQNRSLAEYLLRDDEDRYMAWQLAAMIPYRDAPQPEPPAPGRKAPPPIAAQVAKEGIKVPNKVSDIIIAAVRNQAEISDLVNRLYDQKRKPDKPSGGEDVTARDTLGMAVRRWGSTWRSQAIYSFLVDAVENLQSLDLIERKYQMFLAQINGHGVMDAYTLKPMLDGKALAKALDTPPGIWMKEALDVVMAWQLRNPDITDPSQAIVEVEKSGLAAEGAATAAASNGGELSSSLAKHFLKLTLRPLFQKARPSNVTETGRKVTTTQLPKKMTAENMDDDVNKPWKKDLHALSLLKWAVSVLNKRLVEEVWHLIVPPLLTLLDDWETKYKRLGAQLLTRLLESTSPALLKRTSLGDVFEDALLPCLSYLPTLTPEPEAIDLLSAVYPSLITLARVRCPQSTTTSSDNKEDLRRERVKHVDTIVRKGVIYGYAHCNQYPRIVALLFRQLASLLQELGIDSVKHLQFIIPMLSETLASRAMAGQSDTLLAAVEAMQGVVLNGWPRMGKYKGEMLKGLTLCWVDIDGQEGEELRHLREKMKETVHMLRAAVNATADGEVQGDCEKLLAADKRLHGLLAF